MSSKVFLKDGSGARHIVRYVSRKGTQFLGQDGIDVRFVSSPGDHEPDAALAAAALDLGLAQDQRCEGNLALNVFGPFEEAVCRLQDVHAGLLKPSPALGDDAV